MSNLKKVLIEKFNKKKIVIIGFGLEGKSSYKLIRDILPELKLYIMDKNEKIAEFFEENNDQNVELLVADDYMNSDIHFDYALKTPGIPSAEIDNGVKFNKMIGQANIFLELMNKRIIGITGTKGKSTTSTLIYKILTACGVKAKLVGNIGIPPFDVLLEDDGKTIYVNEFSSYQLEKVEHSPHTALLMNLYEEHLDHHGSVENYWNAKMNIINYQSEDDVCYFSVDSETLKPFLNKIKGNKYGFGELANSLDYDGVYLDGEEIVIKEDGKIKPFCDKNIDRCIIGEHNLKNIMVALYVTRKFPEFDMTKALNAVAGFKGLNHRLQYLGIFNDIKFYNDSIATAPISAISAGESIKDLDTIILGGHDRGIDYSLLVEYLNKKDFNIICMPNAGSRIFGLLNNNVKKIQVNSLEEAIDKAFEITTKGKACTLSPAAPSFDYFKSYVDRGEKFEQYLKEKSK